MRPISVCHKNVFPETRIEYKFHLKSSTLTLFRRFAFLNNQWQSVSTITYILIGHYKPLVRLTTQFLMPLMLCALIFMLKLWDLQFKADSAWPIFWETFYWNFIYSQSFCQKSAFSLHSKSWLGLSQPTCWFH